MALISGTRLGPYEIVSALGAGGMGEVYRATDTKLHRDVALKILPDAFAADPDRVARFQREATTLASLNHPNIGSIYGLEEASGIIALVIEFVDGEDLADRIARGPIPLDEALPIARQIAEALDAAHEQGVIHRDLKPANIKLRADGTVKVLDFGLAKLTGPPEGGHYGRAGDHYGRAGDHYGRAGDRSVRLQPDLPDLTASPTITSPAMMTGAGMILGTAAYMAPEQARGKAVDRRADIWAFGCVLYEMLTGQRTFEPGETVSDAVAAILAREPDWSALPATVPPAVRTLLRRCLEKDPRKRLPHIGMARLEIDELSLGGAGPDTSRGTTRRRWTPLVTVGVAAAAIGLAGGYVAFRPGATVAGAFYRAPILLPQSMNGRAPSSRFALSPDGQRVAYVGNEPGGPIRLWLRSLDGETAQAVTGPADPLSPFWSHDGKQVAFFAGGRLMAVPITGGPPRPIASVTATTNRLTPGSWNKDDVILFSTDGAGLSRIPANGGVPAPLTTLDREAGETQHAFPFFLPDGRRFLFVALKDLVPLGIYIGSLDTPERIRVMDGGSNAQYANGSLLFVRGAALISQPLDPDTGALSGDPVQITDRLLVNVNAARAGAFSVSQTGALIYQEGSGTGVSRLVSVDRSGTRTPVVQELAPYRDVSLAPDGRRGAFSMLTTQGNSDIWLVDLARGLPTQFTSDAADEFASVWSPDGTELAFNSRRKGQLDLYVRTVDGSRGERELYADGTNKAPLSWSPDRQFLLYFTSKAGTGNDIWVLPLSGGNAPPRPLRETQYDERWAQFSFDGRLIAYMSNASGLRREVFVTDFPAQTRTVQVSKGGGDYPRWSRTRYELFFQAPDDRITAATLSVVDGEISVDSTLTPLFLAPAPEGLARYFYDVDRDDRFLVSAPDGPAGATSLTLVINWPALVSSDR